MKKNFALALLMAFVIVLPSCLDDDDGYSLGDIWIGFGVLKGEDDAYQIVMDNKDVLIPVASNYPGWQTHFESGDRVLVNYTILDDDLTDSTSLYYVKVNNIDDILMKGVMDITPEIEDSIGNDPIVVEDYWMTDSLISFKLKYWGYTEIHFLNLVKEPSDFTANDQPIQLELRHNANNDSEAVYYSAFVSFSLNSLRIDGLDSVRFEITSTDYDGTEHTFEEVFDYSDLELPTP